MCRTMNELEKVVADYRGLKAMKEQLDEELKAVEREIIGYLDSNEKLSETGNDFTVKIATKNSQKPAKTSLLNYPLANAGQSIQRDLKQISDH